MRKVNRHLTVGIGIIKNLRISLCNTGDLKYAVDNITTRFTKQVKEIT